MEQMINIYQKLEYIQTHLKSPKGNRNDYGGYNYRSCSDILQSVKPLLEATDTALQMTDEIVLIGDRYYVKATATLVSVTDGSTVSASAMAREAVSRKGMDEAQVTGSASSYARKYALCALLAIDDSSLDPDTNRYQELTGMAEEREALEAQRQTPNAQTNAPMPVQQTEPQYRQAAPVQQALEEPFGQPNAPSDRSEHVYGQPVQGPDGIPLPTARRRRVSG